jgi:hypothetical protein
VVVDDAELRRARAGAQLLGPERAASPLGVVERLGAVQGQDVGAARLAFRARCTAPTINLDDGGLVRTWLMRGTLQYVAAADARWLLDLLGPLNQAADGRRRKQLGLTDALCERAVAVLPEILAKGPLGRDDLRERLNGAGIGVPAKTQAMPHLLGYAAAAGVICLGPELSHGRPSYLLLDDQVPPAEPLERDAALAALARRYLRGHGPGTPADLAAWSGLGAKDARKAFELVGSDTREPLADGRGVRMLGHFDPYLLGYADKAFVVAEPFTKRVRTGGGFVTPSVVVNGLAVATWHRRAEKLTIEPFERLSAEAIAAIEAEVADISRFLGSPVAFTVLPLP